MNVPVKLEIFEGPLDLLLHLIRKNEVDVYDIPVALITRQYLEYLDIMREMNIKMAGEFLVMAATLTHIKSRMLLPSLAAGQEDEDEEDPRFDLVQQLKEHMRIKAAAGQLDDRPRLNRDIFARGSGEEEISQAIAQQGPPKVANVGLFDLVEAFRRLMAAREARLELTIPSEAVSLEDRMSQLIDLFKQKLSLTFEECFGHKLDRPGMVVTFLALLELSRVGLLRVYQHRSEGVNQEDSWGVLRIQYNPISDDQDDIP